MLRLLKLGVFYDLRFFQDSKLDKINVRNLKNNVETSRIILAFQKYFLTRKPFPYINDVTLNHQVKRSASDPSCQNTFTKEEVRLEMKVLALSQATSLISHQMLVSQEQTLHLISTTMGFSLQNDNGSDRNTIQIRNRYTMFLLVDICMDTQSKATKHQFCNISERLLLHYRNILN